MYIQIVVKDGKEIYLLCVCDSKDKNKWVNHYLNYAEYEILKKMYSVKKFVSKVEK